MKKEEKDKEKFLIRYFIGWLVFSYGGCAVFAYQDAQHNGWFAFDGWDDAFVSLFFPFIISFLACGFASKRLEEE